MGQDLAAEPKQRLELGKTQASGNNSCWVSEAAQKNHRWFPTETLSSPFSGWLMPRIAATSQKPGSTVALAILWENLDNKSRQNESLVEW